jgi:hypothetical protein
MHISCLSKLQNRIFNKLILAPRYWNSLSKLKGNEGLWNTLREYLEKTRSTGCNYSDYLILYDYIKKHRPGEILECGTGVSTVIMAYALMENHKSGLGRGRITSMENMDEWYEEAVKLMPRQLKEYVELVYSEKTEYCYSIFRGVGYKDVPKIEYDFVFIDGPGTTAPSDGTTSFDFDFINVVRRSNKPVFGIVDKRMGTCYVLQKVFGVDKVKYDAKLDLGFVGPCTQEDIRSKISSESFSHRIRMFGQNELNLHMGC